MTDMLCQRYTALTPFIIREQKANEVFKLIKRLTNKNIQNHFNKEVQSYAEKLPSVNTSKNKINQSQERINVSGKRTSWF